MATPLTDLLLSYYIVYAAHFQHSYMAAFLLQDEVSYTGTKLLCMFYRPQCKHKLKPLLFPSHILYWRDFHLSSHKKHSEVQV